MAVKTYLYKQSEDLSHMKSQHEVCSLHYMQGIVSTWNILVKSTDTDVLIILLRKVRKDKHHSGV